jgi:hypothetical protein
MAENVQLIKRKRKEKSLTVGLKGLDAKAN